MTLPVLFTQGPGTEGPPKLPESATDTPGGGGGWAAVGGEPVGGVASVAGPEGNGVGVAVRYGSGALVIHARTQVGASPVQAPGKGTVAFTVPVASGTRIEPASSRSSSPVPLTALTRTWSVTPSPTAWTAATPSALVPTRR